MSEKAAKISEGVRAWIIQAAHDLHMAKIAMENGHFNWACNTAEQSAEKFVKAVILHAGLPVEHKHAIPRFLQTLAEAGIEVSEKLMSAGQNLAKDFAASRYPTHGVDIPPHDLFNAASAEAAISGAKLFFDFAAENIGKIVYEFSPIDRDTLEPKGGSASQAKSTP